MRLPRQGSARRDCQGKAGARGRLFAQQMTSPQRSQGLSMLYYEPFDVEQLRLVIETALCFLNNSMGCETIENFFYVSSTVFLYRQVKTNYSSFF